jgi:hypothetical protein
VDLSAVIFVVLAVAWAVYLIPKALKHHDEMASDRLVEGHSERVRILARRGRKVEQAGSDPAAAPELQVEEVEIEVVDETRVEKVVPEPEPQPVAPRPLPTRAAARRAARNRRRVLGVLLLVTAVVGVLAALAHAPVWSPAIPAALVVAFLLVARTAVRKQQQARRAATTSAPVVTTAQPVVPLVAQDAEQDSEQAEALTAQLAEEGTSAETRQEIEAVLADDGSLWDPLPLTLPTYVNKARARRTVRTIELTGMTSSGHDSTDTALAREAEQTAQEQSAEQEQAERRKAAGA